MSAWTDKRLDGKIAIVTGGNSGIGKATTRELASRGAKVVIACRDMTKAESVANEIQNETSADNGNVSAMKLDLVNFQSIREFAEEFNNREERLDILINNAGVIFSERQVTPEGNDLTFQVNHLGPFLLTLLLLDKLKSSAPSRVINVSSQAYSWGPMEFDDLTLERRWSSMKAYGQSKLANIYFTQELARRLKDDDVTSYAVHPGTVNTDIGRDFKENCCYSCFCFCVRPCIRTPEQGAQTSIFCSTADVIPSGGYYMNCKLSSLKSVALDEEASTRLWRVSEELVGIGQHAANSKGVNYGSISG